MKQPWIVVVRFTDGSTHQPEFFAHRDAQAFAKRMAAIGEVLGVQLWTGGYDERIKATWGEEFQP